MTDDRREFGHIYLRGDTYWIRYAIGGKRYRESSGSTDVRVAEKLLTKRETELGLGHFTAPDAKRLTLRELLQLVRDDYAVKGRRSVKTLEASIAHLEAFLGNCRALAITTDRVTAHERHRLEEGAARATINKELAALRRGFKLAVRARRLPASARPEISTPDPKNARQGFFEPDDFAGILTELPPYLCPLFQVAYWTGWRVRDELLSLTWAQVDFSRGELRLDPNTTKTDEGRVFPFDVLPPLRELLEQLRDGARRSGQLVPWVFQRSGKPIKSFDGAWCSAVKRAAVKRLDDGRTIVVRPHLVRTNDQGELVPARVPHDFRRTAARNLIRAGVAQHVVMRLCGWKTAEMFRRYAIVDGRDLRDAVARLAEKRGTTGAQSGVIGG